jgi:hypothetical protein
MELFRFGFDDLRHLPLHRKRMSQKLNWINQRRQKDLIPNHFRQLHLRLQLHHLHLRQIAKLHHRCRQYFLDPQD